MKLDQDFAQAMCEELLNRIEEKVMPLVQWREECRDQLANLERRIAEYREEIEKALPFRRRSLEVELGKIVASGGDDAAVRRQLREIGAEIGELESLLDSLTKQALPQAKRQLQEATDKVPAALNMEAEHVRATYVSKIKEAFKEIFALNQAWNMAMQTAADRTGPRSGFLSGTSLIPSPYELEAKINSYT